MTVIAKFGRLLRDFVWLLPKKRHGKPQKKREANRFAKYIPTIVAPWDLATKGTVVLLMWDAFYV